MEITVFISHAEDLEGKACEEIKSTISEISRSHFEQRGIYLKGICFDDLRKGLGKPQEDIVDPNILDEKCKLIVMPLWTRIGTPRSASKDITGMEYEYRLAVDNQKNILVFFLNMGILPLNKNIDISQIEKVRQFKVNVEKEGLITHCGIFKDFNKFIDELRKQVRENIENIVAVTGINKHTSKTKKIKKTKQDDDEFNNLSKGF